MKLKNFLKAMGLTLGGGIGLLVLGSLSSMLPTPGALLPLALFFGSPFFIWIIPYQASTESPEKPGKAAGATVGAAIFVGVWILLVRTLCK